MRPMGWVLGAAALVALTFGVVRFRRGRRNDDHQTGAFLSLIVAADLLVLAVAAVLA
jgi:hypothetical protein